MTLNNILLLIILSILSSCSQAGWVGYYEMKNPAIYDKKVTYGKAKSGYTNVSNWARLTNVKNGHLGLGLPRDCSGFKLAGFFTPFTPPIPLLNFRSWTSTGKNNQGMCHYFIVQSKVKLIITLKTNNKTYKPQIIEGSHGYIKYIFPIRTRNVESGLIIIGKNGKKTEIPFEYKYLKFWY